MRSLVVTVCCLLTVGCGMSGDTHAQEIRDQCHLDVLDASSGANDTDLHYVDHGRVYYTTAKRLGGRWVVNGLLCDGTR